MCISIVACTKQADDNASTSAAPESTEITTNVPDVSETEETVDGPGISGGVEKNIYGTLQFGLLPLQFTLRGAC